MHTENPAVDRQSIRMQRPTFQAVQSLLRLPLTHAEAHLLRFADLPSVLVRER